MKRGLILALNFYLFSFTFYLCAAYADIASIEKLFLEGRYEKVINESDKLIDSDSRQRDELYYLKGLVGLKTDKFNEARKSFEYIIHKFPKSKRVFDAYLGIGDSYLLEGSAGAAIRIYSEMAEKFRNDRNISLVYYRLSDAHNALGSDSEAALYLAKAKSGSPLSFEYRRAKGQLRKVVADKYVSVQVGSFKSEKNARRFAQKLSREGYDSYLESPPVSGDNLYRVKAGRFKSRKEAESLVSKLKKAGYTTKICLDDVCE